MKTVSRFWGTLMLNSSWAIAGTLGRIIVQIIALIVLSRLLSPTDFGIFAAAVAVVSFSSILLSSDVLISSSKDFLHTSARAYLLLSFSLGVILWLLVLVFSSPISMLLGIPSLTKPLQFFSVYILIESVRVVFVGLHARRLNFKLIAVAELSALIVSRLLSMGLALAGLGIWALLISELFFSIGVLILLAALSKDKIFEAERFSWEVATSFLIKSAHFSVNRLAAYTIQQGPSIVIARSFGTTVLGAYSRAERISSFFLQIVKAFRSALMPVMATNKLAVEAASSFAFTTLMIMLSVFYICIMAVSTLSHEIVVVLLGSGWTETGDILRLLILSTYFRAASQIIQAFLIVEGHLGKNSITQLIVSIVLIAALVTGSTLGVQEAILGIVLASIFNLLLSFATLQRVVAFSSLQYGAIVGLLTATTGSMIYVVC